MPETYPPTWPPATLIVYAVADSALAANKVAAARVSAGLLSLTACPPIRPEKRPRFEQPRQGQHACRETGRDRRATRNGARRTPAADRVRGTRARRPRRVRLRLRPAA